MFSSNQRFSTFFLKADTAPGPLRGQEELGFCRGEADPPLSTHPPPRPHLQQSRGKENVKGSEGSAYARDS